MPASCRGFVLYEGSHTRASCVTWWSFRIWKKQQGEVKAGEKKRGRGPGEAAAWYRAGEAL